MRKKLTFLLPLAVCCGLLGFVAVTPQTARAQGKNAQDWPTAAATAQRQIENHSPLIEGHAALLQGQGLLAQAGVLQAQHRLEFGAVAA